MVNDVLDRLVQGIHNIKGNDVIDFILISNVPSDRIVTYINIVSDCRPHKYKSIEFGYLVDIVFLIMMILLYQQPPT